MSMYLAAILGLCALTAPSVWGAVFPAQPPQLSQDTQPGPEETPAPPVQEAPQTTTPETPSPAAPPAAKPQTTPAPDAAPEPPKKTQAQPADKPAAKKPPVRSKTSSKKRHPRKCVPSPAPAGEPEKKVVKNGGTADPVVQLAPGMSAEQASSQRQSTAELLAATDNNLKQIASRQLNSTQQDSASQIRKYMEQAKAAEQAGDVQRAHNLASKALLLSDDLVKQ